MIPTDFQIALASMGLNPGIADGRWGPKTETAVKQWFSSGRALGAPPPAGGVVDRARFYEKFRAELGPLTKGQVNGFELIFDEWDRRGWTNLNKLAYMLATSWWETNKTMAPVREAYWLSEAWRKKNLRYYPFYGRGFVQLTWPYNYEEAGEILGIDLIGNPDLALVPENAVRIMFEGMERGWFTAKSLDDYIDEIDEPDSEDLREYKEARRIINGTDKATTIGNLSLVFERALRG